MCREFKFMILRYLSMLKWEVRAMDWLHCKMLLDFPWKIIFHSINNSEKLAFLPVLCDPYILLYLRCQKTMEIKVPAQAGDIVLAGCSILRYEIFLDYQPHSFTPGKLEWRLEAADTPTIACLFHIHLHISSKKQDYWMIWTNVDFLRLPWIKHSIKTINNNGTFIPPFDLELLNSTWWDLKNASNVSAMIVCSSGCILTLNLIYY